MTKKDFQAIAAALYRARKSSYTAASDAQWREDVGAIADVLAASNPRFDRERFAVACETGKCRGMRQVQR